MLLDLPVDPESPEGRVIILNEARRREIERDAEGVRMRCARLAGFVREAWHVLEPANPYVHNWHVDSLCAALEAITWGEFNRFLANVPPGTMKSLLVSVFWPAWEWGPCDMPHLRYIATSYSERFTKRDSRRMRDLVTSEWYRSLWPHVQLTRVGETSFGNTRTGSRDSIPFGSLTGGRADRVLIDDPHSTETAESDAEREKVIRIFRESVPLRLVNPISSAIVVIMQRLHEKDVSGLILSRPDRMGYETMVLPMEFEPGRLAESTVPWAEERTRDAQLLFPARFPRHVVERDKSVMGSYAAAGQLQQRPSPRGGGLFKRTWFEPAPAIPATARRGVRWWDLAATVKSVKSPDPDWTVGLLMFRDPDGLFYVADVVRLRGSPIEVERTIRSTADWDRAKFPGRVAQVIPQDPGSAGKFVADRLVSMLAGHNVRKGKEDRDKYTRATPFAAQCEAGNVRLVPGEWNEAFLDELTVFPSASHDDQVDAASGSFKELTKSREMTIGAHRGLGDVRR